MLLLVFFYEVYPFPRCMYNMYVGQYLVSLSVLMLHVSHVGGCGCLSVYSPGA